MSDAGPTLTEMGIKIEPPKTIGGKDMPANWPVISSKEHLKARYNDMNPNTELAIDRFSYNLHEGVKSLTYLAVRHTRDPEDPQVARIKEQFQRAKPQVVLYEGQEGEQVTIPSEESAVTNGGETGLLFYLVQQHNARLPEGEKPIQIVAGDIPYADWVVEFQKLGYSNEDIAVFDLARKIHTTAEFVNNNPDLSPDKKAVALQEAEAEFKKDPASYIFPGLPRTDGKIWTPELLNTEVRRIAGNDISIGLSTQSITQLLKMFHDEEVFRDTYQVKKIEEAVRGHDRVLAVAGSSHPIRQEAALRQLFT